MYVLNHEAPTFLGLSADEEAEALGLALYEVAKRKWPRDRMGSYYVEFGGSVYDYDPTSSGVHPVDLYGTDVYAGEPGLGGFIGSVGKVFRKVTRAVRKVMPKALRKIKLHEVGGVLNPIRLAKMIGRPKDIKLIDFLPGARLIPKKLRTKYGKTALMVAAVVAVGVGAWYLGPVLLPMLVSKLGAAGAMLGKTLTAVGPFMGKFLGKLSSKQKQQAIQQITPEEIAAYERGGPLPANLQTMLDRTMIPTRPRLAPPAYSVSPYPTEGDLVGRRGFVKAGMGTTDMLLIGSLGIGALMLVTGKR